MTMTSGVVWAGPRIAYELTAAVAEQDEEAAGALLASLSPRQAWEVVVALGGQARQAAGLAGGRAGAVRRRQQMDATAALLWSPAKGPALDALRALEVADPGPVPGGAMAAAARYLAGLALATAIAEGRPRETVARMCRRAAALAPAR